MGRLLLVCKCVGVHVLCMHRWRRCWDCMRSLVVLRDLTLGNSSVVGSLTEKLKCVFLNAPGPPAVLD